MKSYSSKELIQIIEKDGWVLVGCSGSHHQFKHLSKKAKVTIPHPKKNLPIKTIKNILRQAGIEKGPACIHINHYSTKRRVVNVN